MKTAEFFVFVVVDKKTLITTRENHLLVHPLMLHQLTLEGRDAISPTAVLIEMCCAVFEASVDGAARTSDSH